MPQVPLGVREKKENRPLKIIVVPHSHNDPGWHKTVDAYFVDQSKLTLDNMVEKLQKYPKMKFVWAEIVFLDLWWRGLDQFQRGKSTLLSAENRLAVEDFPIHRCSLHSSSSKMETHCSRTYSG